MVTTVKAKIHATKWYRNGSLWISVAILIATTYLSLGTAFRWIDIRFRIGPYYVTHWLSWIGTLFIALYTPIYYVIKRKYPRFLKGLIGGHMFGNLVSFAFISMHFAQQLSRPPQFYPDLGTGVALYIVIFILVVTGFLHKFRIVSSVVPHQNRFLHVSVTSAFYIVIIIHILQGIEII